MHDVSLPVGLSLESNHNGDQPLQAPKLPRFSPTRLQELGPVFRLHQGDALHSGGGF